LVYTLKFNGLFWHIYIFAFQGLKFFKRNKEKLRYIGLEH